MVTNIARKRTRKKCLVIPGDGDPCPRCGEPIQIREYDGVDQELPSYPFFHPLGSAASTKRAKQLW
jgi:hypothetical protein